MREKRIRHVLSLILVVALIIAAFSSIPTVSVTTAIGTITIKGRFEYLDELGLPQPMRQVKVYLLDDDRSEGLPRDEIVAWQYTDDSGNYLFTVSNYDGPGQGGRDPYVAVISSNEAAIIKSMMTGIYYVKLPKAGNNVVDGFSHDYETQQPASKNEAWQAIDAVLTMRRWLWNIVGWQRPQVKIYWPSNEAWPSSRGDTIHLPFKIFWDWDVVTVYREYALSILYTLYGNRFPYGWNAVPPHHAFYETGDTFAFVEGWAEFLQSAVENNPDNLEDWSNGCGGNIETNNWFNCIDEGDMDGNIIEGSIASLFWDIFDPANDDPLDLGLDEIFYIMRDIRPVNIFEFWNEWQNRYFVYAGDLSTIAWGYGIDIDIFPPTGSIIINSGATYTQSKTVTLSISASDYGSGVAYMRFSNFPNPWFWGMWFPWVWSSWHPYDTSFSWTLTDGDGPKTVYAQFMDRKGLVSPASPIISDSIILDTVPPTGSISINSGDPYTTSQSVTLSLAYFDATSGVQSARYSNDGVWDGEPWEPPSSTRAWSLPAGDGLKTVYYQVQDNAGWSSLTYLDTIVLDTVNPTGSIVINGGASYTALPFVTLSLTFYDATSGVRRVRYSNGVTWEAWESPSNVRLWALTPGDGVKTVYYQIQDWAGRLSSVYSASILLDTTPPVTTSSHNDRSTYVYLNSYDPSPGSGVATIYYRIDYGPWTPYGSWISLTGPPPFTHTIDYYSVDNAGNREDTKTLLVHYLTVDSNIAYSLGMGGWYSDGRTVTTPKVLDTIWIGSNLYGFQSWKRDTVAVPGNPITITMSAPHWARAGYLGVELTYISRVGDKLTFDMRLFAEITADVNMKIRVTGPEDIDFTMDMGTMTLGGGVDMTFQTTVDLPDGDRPGGTYTAYIKLYDPSSGSLRAQTQMSFSG